MSTEVIEGKPKLLQAVELILAKPEDIKKETIQVIEKYKKSNPDKSESEIRQLSAEKIIANYSYYAAFVGGTTA
ncbi:MAG: hypothetical protein ACRC2U_01090, partial [Aeromonas sp.]